jgi:hypothetical protein
MAAFWSGPIAIIIAARSSASALSISSHSTTQSFGFST